VVVDADDHAGAGEVGVLDQVTGEPHAAGRVQRLVVRASVEPAAHHPPPLAHRVEVAQVVAGELTEAGHGIDGDAGVQFLEQHDALVEGGAEAGRDREPVLGV
jgi:hypothetical protein